MSKDFQKWHEKKMKLDDAPGVALFREREVWWCSLGTNIGFEQDGSSERFTRPVVILTKFNLEICLVIPLTARPREGRYYFPVGEIAGRDAIAVVSQIRLIDRKRLAVKITKLSKDVFDRLTTEVVKQCFPNLVP